MPRTFDYDNNEQELRAAAYNDGDAFVRFSDPLKGSKEIDVSSLYAPRGVMLWGGQDPQFERRVVEERKQDFYTNAAADEAFNWLEENASGRWDWKERSVNHGHSVATYVWLEDDVDVLAFQERFPADFKFKEGNHIANIELRKKISEMSDREILPGISHYSMVFLIPDAGEEELQFLTELAQKDGGVEMIAKGVAYIVECSEDAKAEEDRTKGRDCVVSYLREHAGSEIVDLALEKLEAIPGEISEQVRSELGGNALKV